MIFILLGGLFTNIDAMPKWAIFATRFNPAAYFIEVIRMIVLKGSVFNDIKMQFLAMAGFAVFFNGFALLNPYVDTFQLKQAKRGIDFTHFSVDPCRNDSHFIEESEIFQIVDM